VVPSAGGCTLARSGGATPRGRVNEADDVTLEQAYRGLRAEELDVDAMLWAQVGTTALLTPPATHPLLTPGPLRHCVGAVQPAASAGYDSTRKKVRQWWWRRCWWHAGCCV